MSRSADTLGVTAALVSGRRVPGDVTVVGGRVQDVGVAPGAEARGIAVPGFVDWQVNGFGGVHFTDAGAEDFLHAGDALARAGLVWVAPTFLNTTPEGYLRALSALGEFIDHHRGAGFLGAHLEGPNLSAEFHGAHDSRYLLDGDVCLAERLEQAGPVAMVTLAPERSGVMDVLEAWMDAGVTVSLGHTNADAATCAEAARRGASAITHCWNAHRRFTSRDPGPAGWALTDPAVTVGLIADGIHVAPEVLALSFAAAGDRVALTTDAIAPAGSRWDGSDAPADPGSQITVADGAARLPDGTLAGSVATPSQMLGVLASVGVPFEDAVHALSVPQSRCLGLSENQLRPGDRADITVLGEDQEVLGTWRGGSRVF